MTGLPSKPARALPMSGLSWLAVEPTASFLSAVTTSQAQPEPKRVAAALANSSLNLSKEPKVELIASASLPVGAPPLPAPRIFQKKEWLLWPPALLRTPPRMASGTLLRSEISRQAGSVARAPPAFRRLVA